eukprot:5262755-Amphidinium_carterae.1
MQVMKVSKGLWCKNKEPNKCMRNDKLMVNTNLSKVDLLEAEVGKRIRLIGSMASGGGASEGHVQL